MAFANYPKQEILLPVKGSFIVLSLIMALFLNLLPLKGVVLSLWPDFVALVVLYWCINQPQRVGMSTAFAMGLLMDIGNASTFGQHALAYVIMAFAALVFHRRLLVFGFLKQAPQIGLMLLIGQSVLLLTGLLDGSHFPGWNFFFASATGTLLWPLLSSLLRIPQRPRSDSDALS
ncbi:rod shape-determining protein MreD [Nitrosospira sp. Nl5]|uniref:rod shape-determining protein MreD n=1 Tax=Nitrosospira sp. Nl5 TaxID=200120 RepID=UPI000880A820|nr:rod shape-determining protein MreD [Nitrosospira sp. Nl5]SCY54386.1 rod shape-determining protein MreD [Nitrosospira sp. Nl5]